MDKLLGRFMARIWLLPILGSGLILIQALLNWNTLMDAIFSLSLSVLVIVAVVLSRRDVPGTGFLVLICASIMILSPLGFGGFEVGYLLVLAGGLFLASGEIFTISVFFFYLALGAIALDLILFLAFL